ncbi:PrsW family intramembrane metalloprotease [Nonomuraea sp. NPDC050556]|uniref:PrsW family intramembrane metalloprotease n=1 Tax=Nonomuraea sp. NPDC050556 TaxID=3364369 RepID=UPI00378DC6E5
MSRSRVDVTAVLRRRRQGSVSPGLLVTLIGSAVCLVLMLLLTFVFGNGSIQAFAISLILGVLPFPLLIFAVLLLDRLKPMPWKLLLAAFLWGAGIATLVSFLFNTAGSLVTEATFGQEGGQFISAAVGAPLVEESAKGAVLLGFLLFRRRRITSLSSGIILAAMVGLGFAWVEDVLYYIQQSSGEEVLMLFVIRGLATPLLHPLFTSMTGIGIAVAAMYRNGAARVLAPFAGWTFAVILHGLWNGSGAFGFGGLVVVWLLDLVVLIGIVVLAVVDRRKVVASIARYLPAYIPTGLVTPADITMLSSMGGRGQARAWARSAAGPPGGRAMADYQLSAVELAALHRQVEYGVADQAWPMLRDAYLMHMDQARQTFLRRMPLPPAPQWTGGSLQDTGFLRRGGFQVPPPPQHQSGWGQPTGWPPPQPAYPSPAYGPQSQPTYPPQAPSYPTPPPHPAPPPQGQPASTPYPPPTYPSQGQPYPPSGQPYPPSGQPAPHPPPPSQAPPPGYQPPPPGQAPPPGYRPSPPGKAASGHPQQGTGQQEALPETRAWPPQPPPHPRYGSDGRPLP